MKRTVLIAAVGLLLTGPACKMQNAPIPSFQPGKVSIMDLEEAERQARRGSFAGMRKSLEIYRKSLETSDLEIKQGKIYIQTLLLFALRCKELGIEMDGLEQEAADYIAAVPELSEYARYVDLIDKLPLHTVGIFNSEEKDKRTTSAYFQWMALNIRALNYQLRQKSGESAFFAYLSLSFHEVFGDSFWNGEEWGGFGNLFPDSPLMAYKRAVYPGLNHDELAKLSALDYEFFEAEYFLGEIELDAGRVLSAEKHILKAMEGLSDSPALLMSLTRVYFATEELDVCLDYIDQALKKVPDYRAALLSKAQCLWFLGQYQACIEVLDSMLELGEEYLGEIYYWRARSRKELNRLETAWADINLAEIQLPNLYEVPALKGLIAYARGDSEEAEKCLVKALDLYPFERESAFYLGKIHAERKSWEPAARYYEKAAELCRSEEDYLTERIDEVRNAELSLSRKQRLLRKNGLKLAEVRRIKAVSQYNAAAGFMNLGNREKALQFARLAAEHPALREQAEMFLQRFEKHSDRTQ